MLVQNLSKIITKNDHPETLTLMTKGCQNGPPYFHFQAKTYKIKKNEADEEVEEEVVIDGACIRTPDEDIKWAVEQEELAA